jgi:filamentous hemagglutinin family protein
MFLISRRLILLLCIPISSIFAGSTNYAIAQIPDTTLPSNSTVTLEGTIRIIEGGTPANGNLFHSFQEFSVPTGSTAFFNNAVNVQNIITRVTGQSISNIDGLIRTNGSANLFLLNPNGIIFGKNAALNIGGSFFASTATSLNFADGTKFSASAPQTTSLLTISVPIGLQFGGNAGSIINQSQSKDNRGQAVGLQVQPGRTLALVGGKVSLDGGLLQALDGRIELAGVNGLGMVGLNPDSNNLFLSVPSEVEKADVALTNQASVSTMDKGVGSIAIAARNLDITGGSKISAGIKPGLTKVANESGDISLNATRTLKIDADSLVENVASTRSNGNTGDINVNANTVELQGGRLITRTLGRGDAGDINIKASDILIINPAYISPGRNPNLDEKAALDAGNYRNDSNGNFGFGRSGNIALEATGSIYLRGLGTNIENKVISTYNRREGKGGGGISLKANGSISLDNAYVVSATFSDVTGTQDISLFGKEFISIANNSHINTRSFFSGNSGRITIESEGSISIQNSRVTTEVGFPPAVTNNPRVGDAGDIKISGKVISIIAGAEVTSQSFNGGKPGKIEINAKDKVEISGRQLFLNNPNRRTFSPVSTLQTDSKTYARGEAGDISVVVPNGTLLVSDAATIKAESGNAFRGGNITVEAKTVELRNGGQLITNASGNGDAGNININKADRVILSGTTPSLNQTSVSASSPTGIFANTASSQGGNIAIDVEKLLIMRHKSQISALAGQNGNGGNITVNAHNGFIVAFPKENSDIVANAFNGSGGKVSINANAIFGMIVRDRTGLVNRLGTDEPTRLDPQLLQTNDITAISQTSPNLNGQVNINRPDVDPSGGLVELSINLVDASQQIATGCGDENQSKGFMIVTGRGGMSSSPTEPLIGDAVIADWVALTVEGENNVASIENTTVTMQRNTQKDDFVNSSPIVEAQGWVINNKGDVVLVASTPSIRPDTPLFNPASCSARPK